MRISKLWLLVLVTCCGGCFRTKMSGPVTQLEIPSAELLASYAASAPRREPRSVGTRDRPSQTKQIARERSYERPAGVVGGLDNFRSSTGAPAPGPDVMEAESTERLNRLFARGDGFAKSICSRC